MASQTVSDLADIMKEVWSPDRLVKQFYAKHPWLDRVKKTDRYTIGEEALVPVHKGRSGATTVLSSAGGAMNAADRQRVDRASFGLAYNYHPISIEFGALNQAVGGNTSVVEAKVLEVEGAVENIAHDFERQCFGNGDALIAECTTTSSSTTVNLLSTGYGYDAIVRGWLRAGQTVDIGTTSSEGSVATDRVISSVTESSSDPEIVISGAAVTTATGDYVSIANARSGSTSKESSGLRTIYGSTTSSVGGLDPDTAGEEFWKPAKVDTATVMSVDVPLGLQQAVFQKTGGFPTFALTSIKQLTNLYSELRTQQRFTGDMTRAGNVLGLEWNGMTIEAMPNCPDREWYQLTPEDLLLVTGRYTKPVWMSDVEDAGGRLRWSQNNTNFVDALAYPAGLAVQRRNSGASDISLTA